MTATAGDRRQMASAADYAAGTCWRDGDLDGAARWLERARALDPGRAGLWDKREATIRQATRGAQADAEATGGQPAAAPGREPGNELERQLAARGIAPDDPAMEHWRQWNALCYQRRDAGLEAGQ
jgi:hypothetical protein